MWYKWSCPIFKYYISKLGGGVMTCAKNLEKKPTDVILERSLIACRKKKMFKGEIRSKEGYLTHKGGITSKVMCPPVRPSSWNPASIKIQTNIFFDTTILCWKIFLLGSCLSPSTFNKSQNKWFWYWWTLFFFCFCLQFLLLTSRPVWLQSSLRKIPVPLGLNCHFWSKQRTSFRQNVFLQGDKILKDSWEVKLRELGPWAKTRAKYFTYALQ